MPFESDKQKRFMFSQKPEIAQRFAAEGKANVKNKKDRKIEAVKRRMQKNGNKHR